MVQIRRDCQFGGSMQSGTFVHAGMQPCVSICAMVMKCNWHCFRLLNKEYNDNTHLMVVCLGLTK